MSQRLTDLRKQFLRLSDLFNEMPVVCCFGAGPVPDSAAVFTAKVAVVTSCGFDIKVIGGVDAAIGMTPGQSQRWFVPRVEKPSQCAPHAHRVMAVHAGLGWVVNDAELGADVVQGQVRALSCFGGPPLSLGERSGDGLFWAFGDGGDPPTTNPRDSGEDADDPRGLSDTVVGKPVQVIDLARWCGHPVRGVGDPGFVHCQSVCTEPLTVTANNKRWSLFLHLSGVSFVGASPAAGLFYAGQRASRANPSGTLYPDGTARYAHRFAALDTHRPSPDSALYRVRVTCGVSGRDHA